MDELGKVARVLKREAGEIGEVLLVLDGTVGQNGIGQARSFSDSVGVTGIVLTKLDGTARGGIAIAVEQELDIPVKYIGVGEGVHDLVPFEPRAFVEALLEP
jgi:fused signal recognition particle receptor